MTSARLARGRGAVAAAIFLCAASQVVLFAVNQAPRLARIPETLDTFLGDRSSASPNPEIAAFQSFPEIAERIPRTARTLVVTPYLDLANYEFYFVPRPFRLLRRCPPSMVEFVRENAPEHAPKFEERYDQMLARGVVLTPQRLAEDLAWCDFVIVFASEEFSRAELDLSATTRRLELVSRHLQATLYRVFLR